MLVTLIAHGFAILLIPKASIIAEKMVRRGLRNKHDYDSYVLQRWTVSDAMDPNTTVLPATCPVLETALCLPSHAPKLHHHKS